MKEIKIYAHRGFHNKLYPENSMGAFINAVYYGLPIELDVRLSKDGIPFVFHDKNLYRMTGIKKQISDTESSILKNIKLLNTDECIPALETVLENLNGKVPLLIEIKTDKLNFSKKTENATADLLKNYNGEYSIQSFSGYSVHTLKLILNRQIKCGILSSDRRFKYSADFINYKLLDLTPEKINSLYKKYKNVYAWTTSFMTKQDAKKTAIELNLDGLVCNIII